MKEKRKDVYNKVLARLAVEIMESEMTAKRNDKIAKEYDAHTHGHVHGVRRALYLVKELIREEDVNGDELKSETD